MCGDKEIFTNLNTFVKSTLKLGNNSELSVFGKEMIDISMKDGSSNFIYYVLYVQNLHHNSLSIGRLSLKCYNTVFDDKVCTVSDPKRGLISNISMNNSRLFPLSINYGNLSCFSFMLYDNDTWL